MDYARWRPPLIDRRALQAMLLLMIVPRIGIAGWAIPREQRRFMTDEGSHLERYARRFAAVEINSSFYRPHRRTTYERWSDCVPNDFRFSVKVPKIITHELRLRRCRAPLSRFLDEVGGLREKLSVLLVQLPPSLEFAHRSFKNFFAQIRSGTRAHVVCEPRHASWFDPKVGSALERWHISRVAADPSPAVTGEKPGGNRDLIYFRLHGSPRMYYSKYDLARLSELSAQMKEHLAAERSVWCIFDNTAEFAAWDNALDLKSLNSAAKYFRDVRRPDPSPPSRDARS
jgi:uncharacterized protein YecE (DUF72 family)